MHFVLIMIVAVFVFLIIALSGLWMNKSGKPYNAVVLAIHKLLSTGILAFIIYTLYQWQKVVAFSSHVLMTCIALVVLFLIAIITGGVLSTGKQIPSAISLFHKASAYISIAGTGITLFLLKDLL
jgi:hypothetical protein